MLYKSKVNFTKKDILEKEFKIDTRGFRPQEVDKFLDIVIQDYEAFGEIIDELEEENKNLLEENLQLKKEIRSLSLKIDTLKDGAKAGTEVSNADLLRRLSNLEKIIYNKD